MSKFILDKDSIFNEILEILKSCENDSELKIENVKINKKKLSKLKLQVENINDCSHEELMELYKHENT